MAKQPSTEPTETKTDTNIDGPLVNEKGQITDAGVAELTKANEYIAELEAKNVRLIEKKNKFEAQVAELRAENQTLVHRAATHGESAKKMRVFCELINGNATRFLPNTPTNTLGIKSQAELATLIQHLMGVAEVVVDATNKRFYDTAK